VGFLTRSEGLVLSEGSAPEVEFCVMLEVKGSRETLFKERTPIVAERWRKVSIDLRPWAGQEVVLVFETRLGEDCAEPVAAVWNAPRLLEERPIRDRLSRLTDDVRKLGRRGLKHAFLAAMNGKLAIEDERSLYRLWIEKNSLKAEDIRDIAQGIKIFSYHPTISIITPVYNTDPRWLRKCIESVRNQLYPHWELCLADDASTEGHVGSILREYCQLDPRIKVVFSESNHGTSNASNQALALATGEFVGLLDHDDELAPDALFEVAKLLQSHREADIVYTDEDKLDSTGLRSEPFFKPDWSPEYLLSCMYTCHFSVYRKERVDEVGGFRSLCDGSQDYDLMLRVVEATGKVFHIPRILYHWRKAAGSAAGSTGAKPYAYEAAKKALADHLKRRDMKGTLLDGQWHGHYRVRHEVDSTNRVSVIVSVGTSSGDARKCVESIRRRTRHPSYEILISVHEGETTEDRADLDNCSERVLRSPRGMASSRLRNLAARETDSPYLLFVEGNTEVITDKWLEALLEFSQQAEIGVVGAKLLSKDGRIRHAGTILGLGADGIAGDSLAGFPADTSYHFGLATDVRNCSAVTGSCMMVRRDVFDRVGGFDEEVPSGFDDLDFCLRVRRQGFRIVWTPYAQLYQHGAPFRELADAEAVAFMKSRWGAALLEDPYYNPNLTRDREDFGIRL
jgi:GT2 family glycosyltransferase